MATKMKANTEMDDWRLRQTERQQPSDSFHYSISHISMQVSSVAMAGSAFLFDLKKDENKNNNNRELKMNCYLKESFSLNGNIHQYI